MLFSRKILIREREQSRRLISGNIFRERYRPSVVRAEHIY